MIVRILSPLFLNPPPPVSCVLFRQQAQCTVFPHLLLPLQPFRESVDISVLFVAVDSRAPAVRVSSAFFVARLVVLCHLLISMQRFRVSLAGPPRRIPLRLLRLGDLAAFSLLVTASHACISKALFGSLPSFFIFCLPCPFLRNSSVRGI